MKWLVAVFLAYLATAKFGLIFAPDNPSATTVWPPSGIALAAMLLLGPKASLAVWPAAFLANITNADTSLLSSLGIACGNTLEGLAGVWLLSLVGFAIPLRLPKDLALIWMTALVATTVSATIGVTSLIFWNDLPGASFWDVWRVWWLGDAGGVALVCPAILLLAKRHA